MAISYDRVEKLMDEAVTALESSDFATAEIKATAALGVFSALPIEANKAGHASGGFSYSAEYFNQFLMKITSLKQRGDRGRSKFGMEIAKARFGSGRCGDTEDCCEESCL